jgi:hypothetical protein
MFVEGPTTFPVPMRISLLFALLFVSIGLSAPPPALGQSFNYAADCAENVDNATIHASASDSLALPDGRPIEPGDTLAVYTADMTCAGYGVWTESGVTFAAAGPDSTTSSDGYASSEQLKFEVFDVSEETATDLDSSVTYASCAGSALSLCRDDGAYADGTVHQVRGIGSGGALPVELAAFTASLDGATAVLTWKTSSEMNNAGFAVQHQRPEASGYSRLGFVEGAGTTNKPQSYRYRAKALPSGVHRFRLRQVDVDGSATLSDPVSVEVRVERTLALRAAGPNPVRQATQLAFTVKRGGPATMTLYNVLGQRVKRLYDRKATPGNRYSVEVRADDLTSGTYFARLRTATGTRTQRIVVVR